MDVPRAAAGRGLIAVVALAWAALFVWSRSDYAPYLGHAGVPTPGARGVALFLGAWTLMVVATMVPATAALRRAFGPVAGRRRLTALLDATFLIAWLCVGAVFYAGDLLVHEVAASSEATASLGERFLLPASLVLAGAYQLSRLSRACLTRCRSPESFLYRLWRGRAVVDTVKIGLAYATSCVGCCWALMLTMFAVGMANLAWMALLTAIVLIDRAARGRSFSTATGLTLILTGALLSLAG